MPQSTEPAAHARLAYGSGLVATWLVLALAVLYAPVAISSMWFTVLPDAPRLQEMVDSWTGGSSYAVGAGSLTALRSGDYVDHRAIMIVHTVLGGLALLVAAGQGVALRRAGRRTHRLLGRAYLVLMLTSMVAALLFLVVSPQLEDVGQVAFRWQLWVLALSTMGTGLVAAISVRRGDTKAHRAWIVLNLAFLLTAPVLRLLWGCLAPLFPRHDMLTNLEVGSVTLAVAAPLAGSLAVMAQGGHESGPVVPRSGRRWPLLALLAGLGCAVVVARCPSSGAVPAEVPFFHAVPVLVGVAICSAGLLRSAGNGGPVVRDWHVLLLGVAVAPWAAVTVEITSASALGAVEAYYAGLMVAPGFPVVAAFASVVRRRSDVRHAEVWGDALGGRRELLSTPDV